MSSVSKRINALCLFVIFFSLIIWNSAFAIPSDKVNQTGYPFDKPFGNSGDRSRIFASRDGFTFAITADEREFTGPGIFNSIQYYRGACEMINWLGGSAFLIGPGDIDPPWDTWWTITDVFGSNYTWYPVLGNHETETLEDMAWLRAFNPNGNTLPNIVTLGPSGTVETMYAFDYGLAHFVVLNEYFNGTSDIGTDGNIVDATYYWLAADLAATTKPYKFVIGHEPAYVQPDADNGRLRHVGDSLDQYPTERDRFWNLLQSEEVTAYICGHTHNYSTYYYNGVWQIDAGHARGLGDTGARSTFLMIHVDTDMVTYDTWRDDMNGGPYTLMHSGILYGSSTPTITPTPDYPPFTPTPFCSFEPIVGGGSVWKYLDTGVDQGVDWRLPTFDDSTWQSGPAQLGYGDGDEATVISYGQDPLHKYVTSYFRHTFTVSSLTQYQQIRLGLLRDDGAVVYLNGEEIFRSNMPSGTITYSTYAVYASAGSDEVTYFISSLDPQDFIIGTNVLAVEVHQVNDYSTDLSFDLYIEGCVEAPTPTITFTPTITDTPTITMTPTITETPTPTPLCTPQVYIATGSIWKYLDDGTDQGAAWRDISFDDSAWASGPAQLGYGDGDEATVVGYGPDSGNKYLTTYFRQVFTAESIGSIHQLRIGILRDDGAMVYLNGVEVARSNMPPNEITYQTPALATVADAEETTYFYYDIDPAYLAEGLNVVAVEIHQINVTSSDISFDLVMESCNLSPTVNPTPTATSEPHVIPAASPLGLSLLITVIGFILFISGNRSSRSIR